MAVIDISKENQIATVMINRPKALNALNADVLRGLHAALNELAADEDTALLVITGAGEKAFVAGADIKEMANMETMAARQFAQNGQALFRKIQQFPKPVIAAVNGYALGGGCELALACHMRLAAETARFGLPEVSLGLIPGYGGTQRLPRLVGKGIALEMILGGGMVKAQRAYEVGLVNQVVPAAELSAAVTTLATTILSRGPVAVRFALEAVQRGCDMSQEDGERLEASLFGLLATTDDFGEGLAAFVENRKADFKGK